VTAFLAEHLAATCDPAAFKAARACILRSMDSWAHPDSVPSTLPAWTGVASMAPVMVSGMSAKAPAKRPRPVVRDAAGEDMRPAPEQARCAADLVAMLNDLREWADLSLRAIADECGQMVSYATVYRTLTGTALPPLKSVMAVVVGCGGDQDYQQRFATAWRRIKTGRMPGAVPVPAPLRAVPAAKTG